MSPTPTSVCVLVQKLTMICPWLPPQAIPEADPEDNIYHIMTSVVSEDPFSTFNWRFDILYAKHLCDQNGWLLNIQHGQYGLDSVVLYLQTMPWSQMPLEIVKPKLLWLVNEVVYIVWVSNCRFLYSLLTILFVIDQCIFKTWKASKRLVFSQSLETSLNTLQQLAHQHQLDKNLSIYPLSMTLHHKSKIQLPVCTPLLSLTWMLSPKIPIHPSVT